MTELVKNATFFIGEPTYMYKAVRVQGRRIDETYHSLLKPHGRWPVHTKAFHRTNGDYQYYIDVEAQSKFPGIMTVGLLEEARRLMMLHFDSNRNRFDKRDHALSGYAILMGQVRGEMQLAFDSVGDGRVFVLCAEFFRPLRVVERVYFRPLE